MKFETLDSLPKIGEHIIEIPSNQVNCQEFNKEKDLLNYIVDNIDNFCKDFLNDELITFEIEKSIFKQRHFSPRGKRIDLYIKGKKKEYIIEIKNSIGNIAGIGQILDYGRTFIYPEKELLLITTHFDLNTAKTISHYNLPIRYIFINKRQFLEYYGESKT